MAHENLVGLTVKDVSTDDALFFNSDIWLVIMVTNDAVWLKSRTNGASLVMSAPDFNSSGFERWNGQGPEFKVFPDQGFEKA